MDGLVEYLGAGWRTVAQEIPGVAEVGDDMLTVSLRPEPLTSFQPHDICLTVRQARRLLADLQSLFDLRKAKV